MSATPLLEARRIAKRFGGVVALDGVDLALQAGAVHAIVGENGAGKSTLMKILSGVLRPDEGELRLGNANVRFDSPRDAERAGIAIIHQELNLVPALTVAENIFLAREPRRGPFVDRRRMERDADAILVRLGHRMDVRRDVARLGVADRQVVEIAKALSRDTRVLIMDEPTTALGPTDVARLFTLIRTLIDGGAAIAYISHRMEEVFRIADEITVLRDGRRVAHTGARATTPAEVTRAMVGRELAMARAPRVEATSREEMLSVAGLSSRERDARGRPRLREIAFSVARGEVLGVAGLMGSGRSALLESVFGVRATDATGRIAVNGAPVTLASPHDAIAHGLALVTEDRGADGLLPSMSVTANLTLAQLSRADGASIVAPSRERALAREWVERLAIKTPSLAALVTALSGGNQQKVLLARWLMTGPRVLLLDEPTKGVDIAGKAEIHAIIARLANEGMAIVVASSELPELLALADRILVMREGAIAGTLSIADASEERIIAMATTAEHESSAVA